MGRKKKKYSWYRRDAGYENDYTCKSTVYYAKPTKDIHERHKEAGLIDVDDEEVPIVSVEPIVEGINPVIHFPMELSDKIRYITAKLDSEWICVLKGKRDKNHYHVSELVIPTQKNSAAHTLSEDLISGDDIIGWLHSHSSMGAFFSSEDEETNQCLPCSVVVNKANEYEAQATVLLETKREVKMNALVDWGYPVVEEDEEPEWYKEIKPKFNSADALAQSSQTSEAKAEEVSDVSLEDDEDGDYSRYYKDWAKKYDRDHNYSEYCGFGY
jgi:hypothetical protein